MYLQGRRCVGADWSSKSPTYTSIIQVKEYVFMSLWPVLCVAPLFFRIFFTETWKVILSFFFFFFFTKTKVCRKGRSAWPLSGKFFWTWISKSFPEIFFLCAKNVLTALIRLDSQLSWGLGWKLTRLNIFGFDQNGFIGFVGTRLRETRSLWDLHRSWS